MEEKINQILSDLGRIEEELTDIAFQMLSEYLQGLDPQSAENEKSKEKDIREQRVKEIEKNLVKVRRSVEKARQTLLENPALKPET